MLLTAGLQATTNTLDSSEDGIMQCQLVPGTSYQLLFKIQSGVLTQVRVRAAWTLSSAEVPQLIVENQIFGPVKMKFA